jgi:hypothetical protein
MGEVIPLPERRAQEKRPIHLEFTPRAFPTQRFALRMDWNDVLERWTVEIEHLRRGFQVTNSVASLYRPYSYMPFLVFLFADPSGEAKRLTPDNLGDDVKLFALPGPSGRASVDEEVL